MKKYIKKILLFGIVLLSIFTCTFAADRDAPSYGDNFSNFLKGGDGGSSNGSEIEVYTLKGVSPDKTLADNIRCMFYPNVVGIPDCGIGSGRNGGVLWDFLVYIGYALIVVFVVMSGIKLVTGGSNADKVKSSFSSLLYILIGSLLFFGSIWILQTLKVDTSEGATGLANSLQDGNDSLLFFVLSFAKAFAFIAAVIMIVVHGFKMFSSSDKAEKVKAGFKGIFNVIIALVIIKLIDYIYYVAQLPNLVTEVTTLIIEIAKVIGFIIGALMVIMLLYAGFLLLIDQGSSKQMEKAKNIIVGILISALVIFALLLIIYQIFNEFA